MYIATATIDVVFVIDENATQKDIDLAADLYMGYEVRHNGAVSSGIREIKDMSDIPYDWKDAYVHGTEDGEDMKAVEFFLQPYK